jgi:hypothetical protein
MACSECGAKKGHLHGCEKAKPSKIGGERGKKAPPPENTPRHIHNYWVTREFQEIIRDGRKKYRYYYKEHTCRNKGCPRPVIIEYMRRVRF